MKNVVHCLGGVAGHNSDRSARGSLSVAPCRCRNVEIYAVRLKEGEKRKRKGKEQKSDETRSLTHVNFNVLTLLPLVSLYVGAIAVQPYIW